MNRIVPHPSQADKLQSPVVASPPWALSISPNDPRFYVGRFHVLRSGGPGDDELFGGAGHDMFWPGAGSDLVHGGGGRDWVIIDQPRPGSGELKRLIGGDGADRLDYASTQEGELKVSLHAHRIRWGEATHEVTGFERILGTPRNDRFEGDASTNIWRGGGGSDTFVLQRGGGHDRVEDDRKARRGQVSTVELGEGIDASQVMVQTVGETLRISIEGTEDSLTVPRAKGADESGVGQLVLASGERFSLFDLVAIKPTSLKRLQKTFNDLNDWVEVVKMPSIRAFDGGNGIDTLDFRGLSGKGTIDLAAGTAKIGETLYAFRHFEAVIAPDGGSEVTGTSGHDKITAGRGEDVIDAREGDDFIRGWSNDSLFGGEGNDWFSMVPNASYDSPRNTVLFGQEGRDTVDYSRAQREVLGRGIQYVDTPLEVILLGPGERHVLSKVERVIGTAGKDLFAATSAEERWYEGGKGNDRYEWGWSQDGHRTITDHDDAAGNQDVLYLALGDPTRVFLSREGQNLLIDDQNKQRSLRVEQWFEGRAHQIEKIYFHAPEADGARFAREVFVSDELADLEASHALKVPLSQCLSSGLTEVPTIALYPFPV